MTIKEVKMKWFLLVGFFVMQAGQEPYPGQGSHQQPPEGWFCEHQNYQLSVPPAHTCFCERVKDENGVVHEDKDCTVWCHMDHCHCDMEK